MYYLMNKDNIILMFQTDPESESSEDISFSVVKQEGRTPYGFQNITAWIEGRKASKYNACLKGLMKHLECDDNVGFIRRTHANGFISVCDDIAAVQLYLENESYLLTVDLFKKKANVQQNAKPITMQKLKTDAPDFYSDVDSVMSELTAFLSEKGIEPFCKILQ